MNIPNHIADDELEEFKQTCREFNLEPKDFKLLTHDIEEATALTGIVSKVTNCL